MPIQYAVKPKTILLCDYDLGGFRPPEMVATVGFDRLDLFRSQRDQYGKRKYLNSLRVSDEQFDRIRQAVREALGLCD